ncbi:sugar ABC transporter ATP-binding protein [Schaalia sp. ZJ405]|uniref:sugar ABC transporter ATP-binding protein n=1 Tax=unclassified Schaalia TaxID=2691889 RepID=UPI0013EAB881|nr:MULTISPECIES: sugar ABC transporter ATP-binding protein [unclassified Schaalia]QPK81799.1 sugar ABC transporter ATP-binding protein [Schaalia sp. ZJ405]
MATLRNERRVLEMRNITKVFPGVVALDDVNLDVRAEEIHAICGENGAGKSTLMKVLSGVHPHGTYSGTILFDGEEVQFSSIRDSEKLGIVIIHQELALIPQLSIAENMFMGNEITRRGAINWHETRKLARKFMAEVGLDEDPDTLIKDIGVGKQQLVEIAKALAKDVKLLILDEPTSALNEEESAHLLNLMRKQRERGVAQVIISHKLDEIEQIADAVTVIRDGKTVGWLDHEKGTIDQDEIIRLMVGRSLDHRFPDRHPEIGDVKFEIHDWWVRHPVNTERWVCKGANITVRAGEVVGLAGLMGAGRTELARSVFGRSYGVWESGRLTIDGQDVNAGSVPEAISQGIAYLSEDRKMLGLNLLDQIHQSIVSAKPQKITHGGVLNIHEGLKVAEQYRTDLRIKAPSVLTGVGTLSGGNQQKVVLAKWMFTDPEVLILDEPTRGIDVGAKYEIYTFIDALARSGKAVIVISSELPELLGITDRIYTIFEGEVTGELPTAQADQESLMHLMTSSAKR